MRKKFDDLTTETQIALIGQDVGNIKNAVEKIIQKVEKIDEKMSAKYLTKNEFKIEFTPIKRLVYGVITLITSILITAGIMALFNK